VPDVTSYPHSVVITGIGIISPLGIGIDAFWKALIAEKIGTGIITRFDASGYTSQVAGEVNDFNPSDFMERRQVHWTERFGQFSVASARLALEDAKLELEKGREDVGIYIGSALAGAAFGDTQHDVFRERGLQAVKPLLALAVFGGSSVSNVALALGTRGCVTSNANACAAGLTAVGDAFRAVARGDVRIAIAGGAEAPLSPLAFGAFAIINAMSRRNNDPLSASRPFDVNRDGFVMAEGAGLLVLERESDALERGARIYGRVTGFGQTCDSHHMSAPRPDGSCVARAMNEALAEARLTSADVDVINAHASATSLGDQAETHAIASVLGERLHDVPILATKGQHGHSLSATGVWEIAVTLCAMRDQYLPRVVNFDSTEIEPKLAIVTTPHKAAPKTALTNSSGFGGINSALVLQM
jgi:3-oxoacyl-[acyl-carrier-protein] synthase II